MTGENYPEHCIIRRIAAAAITAHAAVVEGSTDGECDMPGGADVGGILGIAMHAAEEGEEVQIAGPGCRAKALVSGAVTRGLWLSIAGASGKLKNATLTADIEVLGKCQHTTTTDGDHTVVLVSPFSCQGA
jgi:hypothetical protein